MTNRKFRKINGGPSAKSRIGNVVAVLMIVQLACGAAAEDLCEGRPNGWKIQDPLECRGYLLCHKGKTYQAYCDLTEKFDEEQQACVLGNCPPCKYCAPECVGSTTPTSTASSTTSSDSSSSTSTENPLEPGICHGHEEGDMVRDKEDCALFYICSGGEAYATRCPANLVFDTVTNSCNYPGNVDCGSATATPTTSTSSSTESSTSSTGPTALSTTPSTPPPTDSSTESSTESTTESSTESTTKSSTESTTESTTESSTESTTESSTESSTESTTESSTESSTESTTEPSSTTPQRPPIEPNSCEGREQGETFRDPYDCAKFYMCIDGQPRTFFCPNGLYFDLNLNTCNFESSVDCNINPSGPPSSSSSSTSTTASTSTTPEQSTTSSSTSSSSSSSSTSSSSSSSSSTSTSTSTTTSTTTPSSIPDSSSSSTTRRPPVNPNSCEGRENGEMYRDPNDCSKFYVCFVGQETVHFCPSGLYFDTTKDVCNYPSQVDCSHNPATTSTTISSTSTTTPSTTTPSTTTPSTTTPSTTTPSTTTPSTTTPSTTTTSTTTPSSTTTSTTMPSTMTSSTSTTTTTTPSPLPPDPTSSTKRPTVNPYSCEGRKDGEMYRDPDNCSKFYVCSGGQETVHFCPSGLYFDTTKDVCNYPAQVDCRDNPGTTFTTTSSTSTTTPSTTTTSTTTPSTTTPSTTTPSTTTPSTTTPSTTTSSTTTTSTTMPSTTTSSTSTTTTTTPLPLPPDPTSTTKRPTVSPYSCDGRKDGEMYRDPDNCSKFYVCSGGQETVHFCPSGLYFDTTKDVCNYPKDVNCNNNPSVRTTTTRRPTTRTTTRTTTPSTTTTTPSTTSTTTTMTKTTTTTPLPTTTSTTTTTTTPRPTTQPTTSTTPKDGQIDWTVKDCFGRQNGTFFRNGDHCRIYYVCRNDMAVKHSCPRGQWFDDRFFVCNLRSLVSCPSNHD